MDEEYSRKDKYEGQDMMFILDALSLRCPQNSSVKVLET